MVNSKFVEKVENISEYPDINRQYTENILSMFNNETQ